MSERPGWVLALLSFLLVGPYHFLHSVKEGVPFFGKNFLVHISVYLCGKLIVRNSISFGLPLPKRTNHSPPLLVSRGIYFARSGSPARAPSVYEISFFLKLSTFQISSCR